MFASFYPFSRSLLRINSLQHFFFLFCILTYISLSISFSFHSAILLAQITGRTTGYTHTHKYNTQEVIQSDLPNIDPSKLNKLRQRLVAPSDFSTNFQFPGHQIFFKDFIIAAEHQTNFIEQLKIVLTNELMEINDSSYETLNLSTIDESTINEHEHRPEYIVKPETLSTMSVLAKFLGLIVARPFIYEFGVNTTVDNRQIELRNKVSQFY